MAPVAPPFVEPLVMRASEADTSSWTWPGPGGAALLSKMCWLPEWRRLLLWPTVVERVAASGASRT